MVLHVMKEMPAWVIIGLFVASFLVVWNLSHDDFIPRIIDGLVGALLTSIVAQRPKTTPTTQISTETVQTDAVNAESMDVSSETVNVTTEKTK